MSILSSHTWIRSLMAIIIALSMGVCLSSAVAQPKARRITPANELWMGEPNQTGAIWRAGNVGIGAKPRAKLDVNGKVIISEKVIIGRGSTPRKYNFPATSFEVRGSSNNTYVARISNAGGSGSGLIIQAGYRHKRPRAIEILRLAPFDQSAEFTFFNDGRSGGLSDARLKTKIRTLDNVLERLSHVRGVNFERLGGSGEHIGLIAQEVEEVFPELVCEMDSYKGVDYARFTAVLVQAVKELNAETKKLTAANQELRQRLEYLEKR